MNHFLAPILYILVIGFLPLIYVTGKTLSIEKLKNKTFRKLVLKDFIRTFPVCALVALPILIKPEITKNYLMIIQAIFMPLMFLELGHIYLFGVRIGLNTFYSFFVSNVKETREFISQNIPPSIWIGLILFYGVPFYFLLHLETPFYSSLFIQVLVVICTIFMAIPFIQNLPKKWPKFKDGYVLNPYSNLAYHYFEYRKNYQALQKKIAQHDSIPFSNILSKLPSNQKQTYIIVIGESSNAMHYSCYGYPRNTNEFTDGIKEEILSFSKVRSQYAQTMPSLEKVLSFADEAHPDLVYSKGSLVDYFKQAGFKTYWLSNQYALNDTIITSMTVHANYNKCFNFGGMKRFEKAGLDEDMLPDIQKILDNKEEKKVIFVHLIGSHAAYVNRYPSEFRHFKDVLPNKKLSSKNQEFLNTYDDSIRYTDWVLAQMIQKLKEQKGVNYLLYFSDHGEDVFDTTTTKLLGHSELANEPMTSVPLRIWLSKELEKMRPDIRERATHLDKPYKLEDLIHTVIDISSLTNADYDPKRSILNTD